MEKVLVFTSDCPTDLGIKINEFIEKKKPNIIDIKFSTCMTSYDVQLDYHYSALIYFKL